MVLMMWKKTSLSFLLKMIRKQFSVKVTKPALGQLEGKQGESLVCQAGILHCWD